MIRRILKDEPSNGAEQRSYSSKEPQLLITKDDDGVIPSLGYLIQEAIFSIDTTNKEDQSTHTPDEAPDAEMFYRYIEAYFARVPSDNIWTTRALVKGSKQVHPRSSAWPRWYSSKFIPPYDYIDNTIQRLLILAQQPDMDGLAAAELYVRPVPPHISFDIRLRWLPPPKKAFPTAYVDL